MSIWKKSYYKNIPDSNGWTITERIQRYFRRLTMPVKPFLVVIDTTDARVPQSGIAVGILNVHVVSATDAFEAKQTLLKVFNQRVQNVIKDYLYAYDLEEMGTNLNKLHDNKLLPVFSFVPLQGGRPPRQLYSPAVTVKLDSQTLPSNQPQPAQMVQQQVPQPRPVAQSRPQGLAPTDIRGRGFQNIDASPPEVKNTVTADQAQILSALGVTPQRFGGDEGSQPRINASVGGNNNLRNTIAPSRASESLSADQVGLLRGIVQTDNKESIIQEAVDESASTAMIDPSLTQVDGGVLSEAEIAQLKSEIKE